MFESKFTFNKLIKIKLRNKYNKNFRTRSLSSDLENTRDLLKLFFRMSENVPLSDKRTKSASF